METVYRILIDRAERGMSDLLLTIADHFYCLGAELPSEAATGPGMADLLATLEARYRNEILALRDMPPDDPRLLRDERLSWLLTLPQQRHTAPPPALEDSHAR